jgi:hypothetical protein
MRKKTRTLGFTTNWVTSVAEKMVAGMDSSDAAKTFCEENKIFCAWFKVMEAEAQAFARDELYFFWAAVESEIDELNEKLASE